MTQLFFHSPRTDNTPDDMLRPTPGRTALEAAPCTSCRLAWSGLETCSQEHHHSGGFFRRWIYRGDHGQAPVTCQRGRLVVGMGYRWEMARDSPMVRCEGYFPLYRLARGSVDHRQTDPSGVCSGFESHFPGLDLGVSRGRQREASPKQRDLRQALVFKMSTNQAISGVL